MKAYALSYRLHGAFISWSFNGGVCALTVLSWCFHGDECAFMVLLA